MKKSNASFYYVDVDRLTKNWTSLHFIETYEGIPMIAEHDPVHQRFQMPMYLRSVPGTDGAKDTLEVSPINPPELYAVVEKGTGQIQILNRFISGNHIMTAVSLNQMLFGPNLAQAYISGVLKLGYDLQTIAQDVIAQRKAMEESMKAAEANAENPAEDVADQADDNTGNVAAEESTEGTADAVSE